jgi:hypothetical protein
LDCQLADFVLRIKGVKSEGREIYISLGRARANPKAKSETDFGGYSLAAGDVSTKRLASRS